MADLLTLIRVADTETTDLEMPAELVEIGWTDVRLYPTGWAIESGPHSRLVNPGMDIEPGARAAHHITDEEVATGMPPAAARELLSAGPDFLCFHNADFDRTFVRSTKPTLCTLKGAKTAWPDLSSYSNNAIRYALGLCLSEEDRAKCMPSHRAGPDTWVTAHILLELLKVFPVEELLEISANPLRLLRFPGGKKHPGVSFADIARNDPSYLQWVIDKSEFNEDVKYSARRALAETASFSQVATSEDPDAWRSNVGG